MRFLVFLLLFVPSLPAFALPVAGKAGMVAAAHPAASAAGVEALRQGGNAVDAAVATAFALAVVEPASSGIGGGGFALVRFRGELLFLDFREKAPAKASRDMFLRDGQPAPVLSRDGPLSAGVPGAVRGYLALHERFGKLPRAKVLAPAIRLAQEGFAIDESYRRAAGYRLGVLRQDPEAARIFLVPGENDGPPEVPPLGHVLVQRDLAETLRTLSKEGAASFYTGSIARKLVADMEERGGILGARDLADYQVQERQPLVGSYRGHAIATAPPPSAGGEVLLATLNVLETLPPHTPWNDPAALHLTIETLKRVYADRILFGDPAFVDIPLAALISKERAKKLVASIGYKATPAEEIAPGEGTDLVQRSEAGREIRESADTTHLSTIDAEGNAVSLTSTINYVFGAGIVAKGTGVLWNDEMDDFAIAPGVPNVYGVAGSEANAVAAGKIPLSSMTPTLVFAGPDLGSAVRMVVGSPGGPRIPTIVLQAIHNHLFYGADVEQAIAQGRIHHQHLPDITRFEPRSLDAATLGLLRLRGHVMEQGATWGNATIIAIDPETGLRTGAADPRGSGAAVAQ